MKRFHIIFMAASLSAAACSVSPAAHDAEEEEHAHEEIELSEEQMKTVDIQTGGLSRIQMGATLKANGELAVDPQDEASVTPLTAGVVKRIVVREGEKVAKGRAVAYVENLDVVGLQQDYLVAREEETLANQELARQEALAREGAGIRRNHQQAVANARIASTKVSALSRQLALYGISARDVDGGRLVTEVPVVSPIAGTVSQITVTTGSYADLQAPLMKIVNNGAVYGRLNIFEKNIADVMPGQKVEVRLTHRPQVAMEGEVVSLTQAMERDAKALTARVKISDGGGNDLVPGMAITALIASEQSQVEALPDDAIVASEGRSYVFAVEGRAKEEGRTMTHFKRVEVMTGMRERGYTQVKFLNPVADGTEFVIRNAFFLGSMTSEHGEHSH